MLLQLVFTSFSGRRVPPDDAGCPVQEQESKPASTAAAVHPCDMAQDSQAITSVMQPHQEQQQQFKFVIQQPQHQQQQHQQQQFKSVILQHQQQHQFNSVIQQHQHQQQQMQLEVLRKRQYRVGLNVFNKGPPERGIQLLIQMGFIGITAGPDTTSSGSNNSRASDTNHEKASSGSSSSLASSLAGNGSRILNLTAAAVPAGPVQHLRPGGKGQDGRGLDAPSGMMTSGRSLNGSPAEAQKNHQQLLASSVAHFLLTRKGLSKQMIGQYLGNLQNSFNQLVLDHFLQGIDLSGLCIDEALRKFQMMFRFPGETQQIERLVDKFSDRYITCNPMLPRVRKSETAASGVILQHPDDLSHEQSSSSSCPFPGLAGDRISTTSSASFDPSSYQDNDQNVQSLAESAAAAVVMNRLNLSSAKSSTSSTGSTASSCSSSSCASSSSSFCNLSHHSAESTVSENGTTATTTSTSSSASSSSSSAAAVAALNSTPAGSHMTRDEVFILSFAIIMLNTDLHVPHNKTRMTCDQWIKNLRGVFPGGDLSDSFLKDIYERIKNRELKTGLDHVSQVLLLQQQLLPGNTRATSTLPSLGTPDRRLVCYCRLFEVPDITRRDRPGQHQREIFLFNDLLLITKLVYTKNPRKIQNLTNAANGNHSAVSNHVLSNSSMSSSASTGNIVGNSIVNNSSSSGSSIKTGGDSMFKQSYSYRASYPLLGLTVKMFVSPLHPFGIKIIRRLDDEVVMIFNARNAHDRNRFVMDLKESIEEMSLMESSMNFLKNNNWKCLPLTTDAIAPPSAITKSTSAGN